MNIIISFIFLSFGANAQDCVQAVVEYTKAVEELRLQSPDVQRLWEEEYGKARDEYNRAQEELRETPVIKNISEKYQETRTKYEKAEKELVEQSPYVQELREKIKELCWDRIWQVFKP